MATKTTRAKKNPVSSEMVKEAAVAYAPTREKTHKEYLIERFAQNQMTPQEMEEFLEISEDEFTPVEIAKIQRVPFETYQFLLNLDSADGRYVYYDRETDEYEQSNEKYPSDEYNPQIATIDLLSSNGIEIFDMGF